MANQDERLNDLVASVQSCTDLPESERAELTKELSAPSAAPPLGASSSTTNEEEEVKDIRAQLQDMALPLKIKAAMFGDSVVRGILVTDSNTLVQQAVLSNPQLRDAEIEAFAANKNVSQNVIRYISNQRSWMKQYAVKLALVKNPKTPHDVSIKLIKFLNKRDVRQLARSKNIPSIISVVARKRLSQLEKR